MLRFSSTYISFSCYYGLKVLISGTFYFKKVTTKTLTLTIQQSDEDLLKTLVTKKMYSSS